METNFRPFFMAYFQYHQTPLSEHEEFIIACTEWNWSQYKENNFRFFLSISTYIIKTPNNKL